MFSSFKAVSFFTVFVLISSCCSKHFCDKNISPKPIVLVISAPSGCGKDTAVNSIIEENKDLAKIISVTTRKMRSNEKDHFDYHFVSKDDFAKMSKEDKFLQEATVYGESRGTLKSDYEQVVKSGKNVVFNVDSQGFKDIKNALNGKAKVVGIFILPPSKQELKNRLNTRGTETKEVIDYRMKLVDDAMKGFDVYDYKIIGDTMEATKKQIEYIYYAEKIKSDNEKMIKHGLDVINNK